LSVLLSTPEARKRLHAREVGPVLYWTAPDARRRYTDPMKSHVRSRQGERARSAPVGAASPGVYAGLERIKHLEEQYARAKVNSREHRQLAAAIRIEAVVFRKSLDADQAAARHDREPQPARSASLTRSLAPGKPASDRGGATGRRDRGAAR
jgi:hypothetical protein